MNKLIHKAWMLALGWVCCAQSIQASTLPSPSACIVESYPVEHICTSDSFFFNQQWLRIEGEYTETLTSSQGCDSIVHLTLWHMPNSKSEFNMNLCPGGEIDIQGFKITAGGNYTIHYQASWGCDSTVIIHVNELPGSVNAISQTLCEGDSLLFGAKWLTESGNYTAKFARSGACDSVVHLSLTKIKTRSPIEKMADGLYASLAVESYQWLACPSYFPIPNANQPKITINTHGNYSLRVENKGCVDTLDCIYFNRQATGLEALEDTKISVYPNPTSDFVKVQGEFNAPVKVEIYSMMGQLVTERVMQPEYIFLVDVNHLPKARYIIRISSQNQVLKQEILVIK